MSVRTLRPLGREAVLQALGEHARALSERPEVVAVILFGSVARDQHSGTSDADLLVLVRDAAVPFPDRAPVYAPRVSPLPVDVFVYTPEEAARVPLAARALAEGVILFDRRTGA